MLADNLFWHTIMSHGNVDHSEASEISVGACSDQQTTVTFKVSRPFKISHRILQISHHIVITQALD